VITLKNFYLKRFKDQNTAEKFLKEAFGKSAKEGKPCKLISYDFELKTVRFRVDHFTNYGFTEDEEQQESEQQQPEMYDESSDLQPVYQSSQQDFAEKG
jgi:predicted alpha/beta superfamily hydrolase